jgi:3-oxoacyl-[acyl-carrier-protein] synthase-1
MALEATANSRPGSGVPLHCWDGCYDPELPRLRFAGPGDNPLARLKVCMSNSFAFGGCNISLLLGYKQR